MPVLLRSAVEIDQLMSALFLLTLLLYLAQSVFSLGESRRWLRRGAVLTLGTAVVIAIAESVMWFLR
jgi:hypothetical protein